ncbi:diguanylate cyclase domain-containing protein [Ottowia sp.]|uniref:diguanylate cyclase domain-containing protein n=1 Tax=Ottowia sp. TaxID=1898956 RepID=UPI003A8A3513
MLTLLRKRTPGPWLTLRQLLTVPYLLLVLAVALVIGALAYRSGQRAVDDLSNQLLRETALRIALATKEHITGAKGVLEAAFPVGVRAPQRYDAADIAELRERFWIATSIHRTPHNYAYYGDTQGRFFGLMRHADDSAELRLRLTGDTARALHDFKGIRGALGPAQTEAQMFEPRQRPWFKLGLQAEHNTWSPIYIDFRSHELVTTFVRRVTSGGQQADGVVATDLPLQRVSDFLSGLEIRPHALAMVVEPDGHLVGISEGSPLAHRNDGQLVRLFARDVGNPLAGATFEAVRPRISHLPTGEALTTTFQSASGQTMHVGYTQLRDEAGLDWWVLVMVPRSDFMAAIDRSARQSAMLSMLAALCALALGWGILQVVGRTLGQFVSSAQMVGQGQPPPPLPVARRDELGVLARSLNDMQIRLQTDALTGLANRDAFLRTLDSRLQQFHDGSDPHPFGLLFVDLNRFKAINDILGHAVGDAVLIELAQRLRTSLRADDHVGRYAGDEFVVLLNRIRSPDDAEAVRGALEAALREPLYSVPSHAPQLSQLGAALGVATCPHDATTARALIAHADADMYRRKPAPLAGGSGR